MNHEPGPHRLARQTFPLRSTYFGIRLKSVCGDGVLGDRHTWLEDSANTSSTPAST